MTIGKQREILDSLYTKLNKREFVIPDPLQFLFNYGELRDCEIVGMIASVLAFGNVKSINASIASVLQKIDKPYEYIMNGNLKGFYKSLHGIQHRWATSENIAELLNGIKLTISKFDSLNSAFLVGYEHGHETVFPALDAFGAMIANNSSFEFTGLNPKANSECGRNRLLALPERGSASKRWHLFLRWMIRKDDVDPGGWTGVPKAKLVVPMDTHMAKLAQELGFSSRSVVNRSCALEVTRAFAKICPDDPVKYDFSLTRLGIRSEMSFDGFFKEWRSIAEMPFEKAIEATV